MTKKSSRRPLWEASVSGPVTNNTWNYTGWRLTRKLGRCLLYLTATQMGTSYFENLLAIVHLFCISSFVYFICNWRFISAIELRKVMEDLGEKLSEEEVCVIRLYCSRSQIFLVFSFLSFLHNKNWFVFNWLINSRQSLVLNVHFQCTNCQVITLSIS